MHVDPAVTAAGRQLAAELRQVREERNVTIAEIYEETRVLIDLIEEFEEAVLLGHEMFDAVYLRAFVRKYAELVGLDPERTLQAVDRAAAGRYDPNFLRNLDPEPPEAPAPDPDAEVEFPTEIQAEAAEEPPAAVEEKGASLPGQGPTAEPEDITPDAEAESADERVTDAVPADPQVLASPVKHTVSQRRARPEVARQNPMLWVMGLIVVVVVVLLVLWWQSGGENSADADIPPVPEAEVTSQPEPEPPAPAPLQPPPDVFSIRIIANEPVQRLKVIVDDGIRRPYWIE